MEWASALACLNGVGQCFRLVCMEWASAWATCPCMEWTSALALCLYWVAHCLSCSSVYGVGQCLSHQSANNQHWSLKVCACTATRTICKKLACCIAQSFCESATFGYYVYFWWKLHCVLWTRYEAFLYHQVAYIPQQYFVLNQRYILMCGHILCSLMYVCVCIYVQVMYMCNVWINVRDTVWTWLVHIYAYMIILSLCGLLTLLFLFHIIHSPIQPFELMKQTFLARCSWTKN